MPFSIEVYYNDGHIDYFPERSFSELFADTSGDSIQDSYSFRFDSLDDGLQVRYRHFRPLYTTEFGMDAGAGPDGIGSEARADAYAVIVPPGALKNVDAVSYNGKNVFMRVESDLVNMAKINQKAKLYLDAETTDSVYLVIAELYKVLKERNPKPLPGNFDTPVDPDDLIAEELGISRSMLERANDYATFREAQGDDYVDDPEPVTARLETGHPTRDDIDAGGGDGIESGDEAFEEFDFS